VALRTEALQLAPGSVDGLLCVDLEDWHQILLRRFGKGPRHCAQEFRKGLDELLDLLDAHDQRATFFVLGMTVADDSGIVRALAEGGHEVATHGWGHVRIDELSRAEFAEDLRRAMSELTAITQKPVVGHRAPEFSIPRDDVEGFFSVLAEAGITYDSSVYPFSGTRYGLGDWPRSPCRVHVDAGSLIELPLATLQVGRRRIPIAGGGWWRLLPGPLVNLAASAARRQGVLLTTYVHNYEFDPGILRLGPVAERDELQGAWRRATLQQNAFRRSLPDKMVALIRRFRLGSCAQLLEHQDWS